jgi:outer membrane protein TolC
MKKILIVITALMAGAAHAMDLSFDDAVNDIAAQSHDIKKAEANLQRAQAALDAANANRWFKVDASASFMNTINVEKPGAPTTIAIMGAPIEIPDNILIAGANVSQPIYTFGKIGHAVDSVRAAIKIQDSGKELAKREVRYAAAQLYWTAAITEEIVAIQQKNLNNAKSARKQLSEAGRANRGNLVKIESDIAAHEISLSDAKFNRDSAFRMLKIMAGIGESENIKLISALPATFNAAQSAEISGNPEWEMLDMQVKMHESNASSKYAGNYPTLAATGSYNYIAAHTDMDVFNGYKTQAASVGLSLSVPIFDGGLNRANATMDAMSAEAARQDLENSKKMKTEEYNTAVRRHAQLRENLAGLENARNLAEKAYGFSRQRFAAGQTSAVELSDVSASLAQLDMAVLNAKFNILMSEEQIKKLAGD